MTPEHVDEVLVDVQCCVFVRFKTYNGARQASQQLIDALALKTDTSGWCDHALAIIDKARADPTHGLELVEQCPWKEMLEGNKRWSCVELFSRRLGKRDVFGWWKHCGFQSPDPPGWGPPPPDKMM